MDCCCEMDPRCPKARRVVVSTSQVLLGEKYRRAMAFGKYLEEHPDQSELEKELQRATTLYRIALHNVLQDHLQRAVNGRAKKHIG